ncbi:MAG: Ig-like domain-containing protein, partial [Actinomycetota bacterium]|nr:Ig-like domain-containing protein [Actinomycetota bacterium]
MPAPIVHPAIGRRRHALRITLLLTLGLAGVLLAGCAAGAAGKPAGGDTPAAPPPPQVTVDPPAGAIDVSPLAPVTVTVTDGKLTQVTMSNPEGTPVAGQPDAEGVTWTLAEPLSYGTAYTIAVTAAGKNGKPVTTTSSFTT